MTEVSSSCRCQTIPGFSGIIIYMKNLLDSDWLRAVQFLGMFCAITFTKKYKLIDPETLLFKVNQSRAIRKWCDLTYCAWYDKKLGNTHKARTVANLPVVRVQINSVLNS